MTGAAVLIAADTYQEHSNWTLPSARASAEAMRTMLIERSGVPHDAIEVVSGRDVSADVVRARILAAGERLRSVERGVLWVYYSGHGSVHDGGQHLFTHVTRKGSGSYTDVLSPRDLVRWMAEARNGREAKPFQAILIVDACARDAGDLPPRTALESSEAWEIYSVKESQVASGGGEAFTFTRALADAATALASSTVDADLERLFSEARARTLAGTLAQEPELRRPNETATSAIVVAGQRVRFAVRVVDALSGAMLPMARVNLNDQPPVEASGEIRFTGAQSEHLLTAHAEGFLTRTDRIVLTAQHRGATVDVPLQPALTVIAGQVHPPGTFTVRAVCPGARPGYHVLESTTDAAGRFELRVPSLRSTRANVLQQDRVLTPIVLPAVVSTVAADTTGSQEGIGVVEVQVFLPRRAVQRPESAPEFASALDRSDWKRALRMADTGRYELAREAAAALPGAEVQPWRRWLDSRWAESWLDEGLRQGIESGDWSKADAVAAWWRAKPQSVDDDRRMQARLEELARERMPLAARQHYDSANAALAQGRFEQALDGYTAARPEVSTHYRTLVTAQIERLQARLYERHMMAGTQAELEGDPTGALTAYARATDYSRRGTQAVLRLLQRHPDLAQTEHGREVAQRPALRLGGWAEVIDATPGATSGHPCKVKDARSGIVFVLMEPGQFAMGSTNGDSDELPVHTVRFTKPFYLAETETTQEQWQGVMGTNPSRFRGPRRPVDSVSWRDAAAFLQNLNGGAEGPFRLPTEAEWEYAARAGTITDFACGDAISTDNANYNGNYAWGSSRKGVFRAQTVDVGSFTPNAWGVRDMHGNVSEWCQDWYAGDYYGQCGDGASDPRGPAAGTSRAVRGGSWRLYPRNLRSASRYDSRPDLRLDHIGFRVARSL